jgi:riboflavin transporter FmnP
MQDSFFTARRLARVGILGALAVLLYVVLPGIPIIPPIYKLDFSTLPVLLAGFSMGPLGALFTALIKDALGCIGSTSYGVGELADFVVTGALTLTAAAVYRKARTFRGALAGMGIGIALMVIVGGLMNYFVLIPFYVNVMNLPEPAIVAMIAKIIPAVTDLPRLIAFAVLPFNLFKGVVVSLLTLLLYKRVSPFLK